MATEPDTLSVTIFGSEYKIKGADPDYIGEVAAYVDSKMRELQRRPAMYVTHQAFLSHDSKSGSPNLRRSDSSATRGPRKPGAEAPTWSIQVQKSCVNGMGGAFFYSEVDPT